MVEAPTALEGWYSLHDMYALDRLRWNALAEAERRAIAAEAGEILGALETPADGHSAGFTLLSQKGDLCLLHWRRTLEDLRRAEAVWAATRLRSLLVPSYSYLAVVEIGGYELTQHAAAMVARAGAKPHAGDHGAGGPEGGFRRQQGSEMVHEAGEGKRHHDTLEVDRLQLIGQEVRNKEKEGIRTRGARS